jgi:hypothetical protein
MTPRRTPWRDRPSDSEGQGMAFLQRHFPGEEFVARGGCIGQKLPADKEIYLYDIAEALGLDIQGRYKRECKGKGCLIPGHIVKLETGEHREPKVKGQTLVMRQEHPKPRTRRRRTR